MSWDGMLPQHNCKGCGEELNPNGHRPAELYLGTYTGLCYKCQNGAAYVVEVDPLDGAETWSHPPHCPSWRRDRETYIAYPGCVECHGKGAIHVSRSFSFGGSYNSYCKVCTKRHQSHPVRVRGDEISRRVRETWKTTLVNHLIKKRLASRRKKRGREDGRRLKDHNGRVIWVYCSNDIIRWYCEVFRTKGQIILAGLLDKERKEVYC